MKPEEEIRKEYAHAQQNVKIMTEVCNNLSDKIPRDQTQWYRGYLAALRWVLEEVKGL